MAGTVIGSASSEPAEKLFALLGKAAPEAGAMAGSAEGLRLPPGPQAPYSTSEDLLEFMRTNFERYGDIYRACIYGNNVYVINSPEYLHHVLLRNWRNYLRRGQAVKRIALSLGNGLISSNGETWATQRRRIQPAFTRAAVRSLWDAFLGPTTRLAERWRDAARRGAGVDVTHDVSHAVLEITLLAIFGEDYARVAPHFSLIAEDSRGLSFAQTCAQLRAIIAQVAEERRASGRDGGDILGMMMRTRDRDSGCPMSVAELASQGITLVIAGHETTASVLNWVWYLISRYPQVEERLLAEIRPLSRFDFESVLSLGYTQRVLEEALRTYPPLWLMTRRALGNDQLGEYFVPAGTEIYISPYLLQRHPRLWESPEDFVPERFSAAESTQRHALASFPFGAGPRNCIGEFFARVEMQVHLALILKDLRLRYEEPQPAGFVADVNLRSRDHFIMRPQLRS